MVCIWTTPIVVAVAIFTSLVAAAPPLPPSFDDRATTVRPSDDPFYHVPDGIEDIAPGTILKHRPPPAKIAAFGFDPLNLDATYQILYRTTDSLGNATVTVLTVLVPHNADMTKVLSYQVAEDAADINCAPSYAFQFQHATGPDKGTMTTESELLLVEGAMEQGWVVIAPDFLGPDAAFLANKLAGHAVLDGIRAAINSNPFTGISKNPTVAMWGYSGGSVASMWAAELQPSYAPELVIAGAAVGGTVPNITSVVTSINGKPHAGLIPTGVVGLMNQYAELRPVVEQHILPQFRDKFFTVRHQCLDADAKEFKNQDILAMFDDRDLVYTNPTAIRIITENTLGRGDTPKIPMFVYKSVADEISPVAETDALVAQYCADGASIQYQRDRQSDHSSLAILAAPKALQWLKETMRGTPRRGCSTKTVFSSILDVAALKVLPKFLLDALLDLLGKPVGPLVAQAYLMLDTQSR
ncbi:Lipase, secreted [Cordyceps fumosorosea ARSEF 2679]|uniref:Lipase, secreted n=1 Tax=Cordyceps fumosorosea (strain ARSEF 2679) TaxID=1081104 RepID=A0A162K3U3_CORFA|nr:Lipase, secreted [Cordyceps fumosorosea ARSEF 2679]OAA52978.1 Lipase, secreted [Cordyceps fumosorosea ARSEF 2679]